MNSTASEFQNGIFGKLRSISTIYYVEVHQTDYIAYQLCNTGMSDSQVFIYENDVIS